MIYKIASFGRIDQDNGEAIFLYDRYVVYVDVGSVKTDDDLFAATSVKSYVNIELYLWAFSVFRSRYKDT